MNHLDPDLQRLLIWAAKSSSGDAPAPPAGFPGRVLANRRPVRAVTLRDDLQRTAWSLSLGSLALIICCGVLLLSQRSSPPPADELSSALGFLASSLTR
ncbi:MAG: hypothetical protein ACREIC_19075 [Limisphaerales bacterium]